jgi:hypothetical protein
MDLDRLNGIRVATSMAALLAILLFANAGVRAQDQLLVPSSSAPPPMKFIPSPDRAQLSVTQDAKSRLKASLLLAETRLLRAEQFTVDLRFISATSELGVYQAIIEDVLRFLGQQKADSNKTRDLFKRLEIQLRIHSTRIEAIRRVTPAVYAIHVEAIWDFSDRARVQALNAFFNDAVMPGRSEESEKKSAAENSQVTPDAPLKKQ